MKTNKLITLALSFMALIAVTSCVEDDDYSVPQTQGTEENAALNTLLGQIEAGTVQVVSIAEVKMMYNSTEPFEVDTDIVVKGYVSSSDATGNFFKEFYIQDAPENPTNGLQITTSTTDTYNKFNKGREVYIKLKDLFIGETRVGNGVTTIGGGTETDQYGTTVTAITNSQESTKMLRSPNTEVLVPLNISFSDVTGSLIGVYVQFDNVEFSDNLAGLRYFDPSQDYDTQRTLQACSGFDYSEFILETSAFSTFKNEMLPTSNGSIAGVITKNYTGDTTLLALNSTDDVMFNNSRCSVLDIANFTEIMGEDFDTATNNTDLDIAGWANFAEAGSRVWREKTYQGNGYAELSGYGSNDDSNIAWMVSPGINVDAQDVEFVSFEAAQHHLDTDDNTLEIFVSTDFDGTDVLGATWEPVSASLPSSSTSWYQFVSSGLIDLSSYSGTLHVAFKYTGSGNDTTLDGAYQVDNFSVLAEM
ncbi:DUF5689 domain-containing protein [Lacinutrix sp. Bg11-31]|uniref:DUF5689 domain-containing protein n=1 Tax=Lacinutrix sp. Bg11-31 TaxID=2057808 RepID=UPI000C304E43|nr:DUF5689 domain-containing protein [Lacinutrix sp. Bg11-31]AUC83140.1 hypothetical protein CW733_13775 [Lacinutrix sp. Bg11-31]